MAKGNPLLPYAGSSGHSGSATSRERAEHEDGSGITAARQRLVYAELRSLGRYGVTVAEVRATYSWHHGQASSVLSVLHKEGLIERLSERRNRCAIYVHPEFVNGRETVPHASDRPCARPDCVTHRTALELMVDGVERVYRDNSYDALAADALRDLATKIRRDVLS